MRPSPDGTYVPAAQEIIGLSLEHIYWGSHNARFDGIGLSSFGDHHVLPRVRLPDFLWRAPDSPASVPEAPRKALDGLLKVSLRHGAGVLTRTMAALRDGGRSATGSPPPPERTRPRPVRRSALSPPSGT